MSAVDASVLWSLPLTILLFALAMAAIQRRR